jgi:hypothetical protein
MSLARPPTHPATTAYMRKVLRWVLRAETTLTGLVGTPACLATGTALAATAP